MLVIPNTSSSFQALNRPWRSRAPENVNSLYGWRNIARVLMPRWVASLCWTAWGYFLLFYGTICICIAGRILDFAAQCNKPAPFLEKDDISKKSSLVYFAEVIQHGSQSFVVISQDWLQTTTICIFAYGMDCNGSRHQLPEWILYAWHNFLELWSYLKYLADITFPCP